jgi:hypothetical protein
LSSSARRWPGATRSAQFATARTVACAFRFHVQHRSHLRSSVGRRSDIRCGPHQVGPRRGVREERRFELSRQPRSTVRDGSGALAPVRFVEASDRAGYRRRSPIRAATATPRACHAGWPRAPYMARPSSTGREDASVSQAARLSGLLRQARPRLVGVCPRLARGPILPPSKPLVGRTPRTGVPLQPRT